MTIVKSSTTETMDRLYAKWGVPFWRYDFNLFLKQARAGTELTSSGKSFQTVGASKAKLWSKCFFTYVQMNRIVEPPRIFYPDGCILYYIFHKE